jgi:hypothetical protein
MSTPRTPPSRSPAATLSKIDIVGNGFGFWKTMPIARRTATTSTSALLMSRSSRRIPPSARAPGISSCMRLMQRTSVDLPHPDGPIMAVTSLGAYSSDTPLIAWLSP